MSTEHILNTARRLLDTVDEWKDDNAEHFSFEEMKAFADLATAMERPRLAHDIMLAWARSDEDWAEFESQLHYRWAITRREVEGRR